MNEREWAAMDEKAFEAMLTQSVSEAPPDDVVNEVNPWKKAMTRVLVGMALCAVTLNFWCLNYILPAIGMVLSLLGFRTLRHENGWFRSCFVIIVIRTAYHFSLLILNTTIFQSALSGAPVTSVLTVINLLLLLTEFFCLRQGLRAVQRKAKLPPRAGGATALIVWYALVCALALIRYSGLIVWLGMLIGYFFILRNLYRLSGELEEAGYSVHAAPVRITDRCAALALFSALIVCGALGYLFFGSYPMDWSAVASAEQAGSTEIRDHLLELGFPEYVLNDLAPEDLAACEDALQVVVDVTDEAVNNGRTVTTGYTRHTVYDVRELRLTGVAVQLSGSPERWILFHHFLWTTDPGFHGTESLQLWPVYRDLSEGWTSDGGMTGRVLYDKDSMTFAAPYYFLGSQTYNSDSVFWGEQVKTDVFAAFSMPRTGENCRGYVSYPVTEVQDGYIINSWVNYTHQRSWFQYPVMTAMENRMTYFWNDAGAFITVQDALQFDPSVEGSGASSKAD